MVGRFGGSVAAAVTNEQLCIFHTHETRRIHPFLSPAFLQLCGLMEKRKGELLKPSFFFGGESSARKKASEKNLFLLPSAFSIMIPSIYSKVPAPLFQKEFQEFFIFSFFELPRPEKRAKILRFYCFRSSRDVPFCRPVLRCFPGNLKKKNLPLLALKSSFPTFFCFGEPFCGGHLFISPFTATRPNVDGRMGGAPPPPPPPFLGPPLSLFALRGKKTMGEGRRKVFCCGVWLCRAASQKQASFSGVPRIIMKNESFTLFFSPLLLLLLVPKEGFPGKKDPLFPSSFFPHPRTSSSLASNETDPPSNFPRLSPH